MMLVAPSSLVSALVQPHSMLVPKQLSRSRRMSMAAGPTRFVNPLDVDGFAEPGGWRGTGADDAMPMLYFLPGMDGSLSTPFMQYPELSTSFELACMTHCDGLDSRASFEELTASCAAEISASARSGRQVLLVGESFGATLAIAVAHRLRDVQVHTVQHFVYHLTPSTTLSTTSSHLGHSLTWRGMLCACRRSGASC